LAWSTSDPGVRRALTPAQETVLYRIAQEALANVAKHARARHAWVTLDAAVDHGQLQVRDDGTGFVTTRSVDPLGGQLGLNHFGLASMRQQIEMAGGTWQLHSRPGHGTTITVTVADPGSGKLPPHDRG
jgi:signal transduction histidine kinase